MKATISVSNKITTIINVFEVKPENQQEVVDLLTQGIKNISSKFPGFISASVHKSLDGKCVTNYGQWKTKQDRDALFKDAKFRENIEKIKALAKPSPHSYTVVSVTGK